MSVKVLAAYATLALIIFGIVAQSVHVSAQYVRDNTIPIGELTTVVDQVSLGDAHSVHAVVDMGLGELTTQGGASDLLAARYTTNITASLPASTYSVTDGIGLLEIHYPEDAEEFEGFPDLTRISEYRSRWDLAFADDVPLDLALIVGKGTGDLDLRGLNLSALMVDMGQGDLNVDLRGERNESVNIMIEVGQGDALVDLRGDWRENAAVDISAGMGQVTVLLPSDTGVVVHVDRGVGGIDAKGLTQDGERYVNDAYGQSDVTLVVDVEVGLGGADLEVSK